MTLNISEGAALRQERSPRRGARRAGAINSLQFSKNFNLFKTCNSFRENFAIKTFGPNNT